MMKHEMLTVAAKRVIAQDTVELTLQGEMAKEPIVPGQFLHIKVGSGEEHMLRRPISIADADPEAGTITIVFKVIGKGTTTLSDAVTGNKIDVLGPCGQGYPVDALQINHALLVGGGIGVPPLHFLAKRLTEKGIKVTMVAGFQTQAQVFYEEAFQRYGDLYIATDDGSYGSKGFVTTVIEKEKLTFDQFFTCGPTGMLKAVSSQLSDHQGFISIEQRMGCGIGACFACVVPTCENNGYKKICKDGPVFEAKEVVLA